MHDLCVPRYHRLCLHRLHTAAALGPAALCGHGHPEALLIHDHLAVHFLFGDQDGEDAQHVLDASLWPLKALILHLKAKFSTGKPHDHFEALEKSISRPLKAYILHLKAFKCTYLKPYGRS